MTPPADGAEPRFPAWTHLQRLAVPFEYPVCFTRDLFAAENPLLADTLDRLREGRRHRVLFVIDAGVAAAHPLLIERIRGYFHDRPERLELAGEPLVVPGGEAAKNGWEPIRDLIWTAGNLHLDRQSFLAAVGGGSVLDMAGFAAGIIHRGVRLLRVPTTTLSQDDAGVGVKNGMDEHGMKNFVGTFAPPFAVLNDATFLPTLPQEQWIGGVAEAFKVAIIKDVELFDYLCAHAGELAGRDLDVMETIIRRTAVLHLRHIAEGGDPFEFGSARPLDFGHWAGHRLEILSGYRLGHGQACAVGIALDSYYALRQGLLAKEELERILAGLTACGLPTWSEYLERRAADGRLAVLEGLDQFREHLGGTLTITLPHGLGRRVEVHQMDPTVIEEAVAALSLRVRR